MKVLDKRIPFSKFESKSGTDPTFVLTLNVPDENASTTVFGNPSEFLPETTICISNALMNSDGETSNSSSDAVFKSKPFESRVFQFFEIRRVDIYVTSND